MIKISTKNYFITTGLIFTSLLLSPTVIAEAGLCKVQPASIINKDTFSKDDKIHLQSNKVELDENNVSRFTGNVVIQQKNKRIETEQAEYEKQTEEVNAQGSVNFITPGIKITSQSANINLKTEQAVLQNAQYQSLTSRARGEASSIEVKSPNVTELNDATYTTCDPGNSDWLLSADSITLNNENHQGSAKHVVLRFKDVPFFYFPYLRFPLGEDRLSGFLFPTIGVSEQHGTEIKIPYYWNIHPQMDATITPWNMTKRGLMLQTEFRYLTENSNGILTADYLDNDKLVNDSRERWHWKHTSQPALGWQSKAEYNYVADVDHLTDFSDNITSTSTTYLIRSGDIAYNSQNWLLNIKVEDHQILSGAEPYQRLPQITFNSRYAAKDNALNYALETEAVYFDHTSNAKVIGQRLHLKPRISYPIKSAAGFFEPKLAVEHTQYNLEQTTGPTELSRTVPTFSLNSGLFFDRDTSFFNSDYIQTLEPQLFYVYVPYKDQTALPLFDTSVYAFNINQSFADYRFNGKDRIGDDNRLTTALATRFINQENGKEVFMARIGQIYYFKDRRVQLNASDPIEIADRSHIIAELKTAPGNWTLASQVEWDPELKETAVSSSRLGYQDKKFNLDLAYRFQRDSLETREMKFNWELSPRWKFNASHLYDIRNEHILENLFAINYESCCWGLQLTTKERYIDSTQTDRGIYLELTLKGLGGFGLERQYLHQQ